VKRTKRIAEHRPKLLVVDILCAGGILASIKNEVGVIRNSPYPYVDPAQDAIFMPSYFSFAGFDNSLLGSFQELMVRKFQNAMMNLFFWTEFGEFNLFNHPTLVNTIIGIEVPRNTPPYIFFTGPILLPPKNVDLHLPEREYILLDFAAFSNLPTVVNFFKLLEQCNMGFNFIVLSVVRQNTSCVMYFQHQYQNLINSSLVAGTIFVSEHLRVHTSLMNNKPCLAVSFIKEHSELIKRLNWTGACLTVHNDLLSIPKLQELLSSSQKTKTQQIHNLLLTWGSKGNIRAANIVQSLFKHSSKHLETLENSLSYVTIYADYLLILFSTLSFYFVRYCKACCSKNTL
jgi:hypothetical protein